MTAKIALMSALLAALLALPTQASGPQTSSRPILLAQSKGSATCELDGRRVPQNAQYCREGQVWRCTPRGTWEKTGKPC